MFVIADQLIAHAIGDYVLQSHWMATEKVNQSKACFAHAVSYTLPFLFLTQSWQALAFIAGTHFIIDRWRLARYLCRAKNYFAPPRAWPKNTNPATGYPEETPPWLAVWLLIITDNTMHILCNAAALKWL